MAKGMAAPPAPREGLWLGVCLALAAALPYLLVKHPQLTDYASHLARYRVMLDGGRSPFLGRYYQFDWILTGNLGADLLIWPLAKLLDLETAGWLIGALLPPLTGLGLVAVEWVLRRRIGVGALLAFALIWSPAMGMGFYNFCLALALALFAFALWVRLAERRWRWLLFMPIGLLVWLCHASGWGVLGVLVFGYEWHRRKGLAAVAAPWPLLLPLVPMLLGGPMRGSLDFGSHVLAYKLAIWTRALRDQSMTLDLASLLVILAILAAALLMRRIDGRLGWAALILFLLTFAMPRHFGGGDYADYRLIAAALMIGLLSIDWPAPPRWALWLAPSLFLLRLGVTSAAWHEQSRQLERALQALDHVPQGARVAGAVAVETGMWGLNPFEHAPSYATVYRDALVNAHFAVPGVHMLRLRNHDGGFVDPSQRILVRSGERVDLASFEPAREADFLWYFGRLQPARLPPGARVLHRSSHSLLARLANPPSRR